VLSRLNTGPGQLFASGELAASLKKEIVPLVAPASCGAKVTVNNALCPAEMVSGKGTPLTENPLPFQLAVETLTLVDPALRVPVWF